MGTEDWILRGTKLITNMKKHKEKIKNLEQRLDSQKYSIKKTKQYRKSYFKKSMKFALKIGSFFYKVMVGFKNEN